MATLKRADDVREEQKKRVGAEELEWLSRIAEEIDRELDGTNTRIWVCPPQHLRSKIKSRLEAYRYTVTLHADDQSGDVSLRIDW